MRSTATGGNGSVKEYGSAIEAERLSVSLGDALVLTNLDFQLGRVEKCIIAGSNGAGKSTFLRTLLGLTAPAAGVVKVLGMRVGGREWSADRRRVGYVNQESVHVDFPISVMEVVEIGFGTRRPGHRQRHARTEDAMRSAGCLHLARRAFMRLSGGEKQRVSLARCLLQQPDLLLLDEPTASLDSASRESLLALLERMDLPILMVTHDAEILSRPGWTVKHLVEGRFPA